MRNAQPHVSLTTAIGDNPWVSRTNESSRSTENSTNKYHVSLYTNKRRVISVELEVHAEGSILGKGGHGEVFRGVVTPEVRCHSAVAIKKFRDMSTRDVEKECHYRIVQEYGTSSAIREMLGHFDYGGEYFLMFVLVDDSLEMEWKTRYRWTYSSELKHIDVFLRNCARFHKKFSHSDAHPRNICRRGDGSFVLIDWAHMRSIDEKIMEPWSSEYASPPCRGSMISPETCDVWSIGCTIVNHLSWLKGSPLAVEFFAERRQRSKKSSTSKGPVDMTPYFHDGDALHSAVQGQLDWLRGDFPGQVAILESMLLIDHSLRIDMATASVRWSKTLEDEIPPVECVSPLVIGRGRYRLLQRAVTWQRLRYGDRKLWRTKYFLPNMYFL
ncbi:hypothetical protein K440DRAFT_644676 [Wilcoxina mikolae CBS 423.85]|nr:hypothetical protein K440DRAFT_644676 [Wilcoxina mikolae CBS 423.85]